LIEILPIENAPVLEEKEPLPMVGKMAVELLEDVLSFSEVLRTRECAQAEALGISAGLTANFSIGY
jgi:hypothetical protein